MNKKIGKQAWMTTAAVLWSAMMIPAAGAAPWTTAVRDGRLEARRGDTLMFAWQSAPLENPLGGGKFAASAFLHPLCTPSGFVWTTIQPDDHKHHFGLWWPWKYIKVDGVKYNCWEIQEGQAAHVARTVKQLPGGPDTLEWEFHNEVVVHAAGASLTKPAAAKTTTTVIHETAHVALGVRGADTTVVDVSLRQQSVGKPVTIVDYRYSGFSWRGPTTWNKDNSRMLTSEGLGRDDANGKPARWVVVSGPTPTGMASVLMMSAAADLAGTPEQLRVWDSKSTNGMPFVNFNPVMSKALPLDDEHPAVANRKYRVLAADRVLDAAAAEAEWRQWLGK